MRHSKFYGLIALVVLSLPFTASLYSSPPEPLPLLASLTLPIEPTYYQQPVKTRWRADKAPPRCW